MPSYSSASQSAPGAQAHRKVAEIITESDQLPLGQFIKTPAENMSPRIIKCDGKGTQCPATTPV